MKWKRNLQKGIILLCTGTTSVNDCLWRNHRGDRRGHFPYGWPGCGHFPIFWTWVFTCLLLVGHTGEKYLTFNRRSIPDHRLTPFMTVNVFWFFWKYVDTKSFWKSVCRRVWCHVMVSIACLRRYCSILIQRIKNEKIWQMTFPFHRYGQGKKRLKCALLCPFYIHCRTCPLLLLHIAPTYESEQCYSSFRRSAFSGLVPRVLARHAAGRHGTPHVSGV